MSVRQGSGPAQTHIVEKPRIYHVLTAGQDQKRIREDAVTAAPKPPVSPVQADTGTIGGGPDFYVGNGERGCKNGVYCKNGKAKQGGDDLLVAQDRRSPPVEEVEYIRQVNSNPDRWEANGLLMLKPAVFADLNSSVFLSAYNKFEVEQPSAGLRENMHSTVLRPKNGGSLGTITSIEGSQINVGSVVAVTEFVDGDGPVVGEGFILRIFFQNLAGKELGTLYALSKRNIEANAPDKDDLEYYLFVDLTKEWTVNGSSRAPPPAAVNIGPALWTADLHEAMEFAAFRSIDLVAGQFTR